MYRCDFCGRNVTSYYDVDGFFCCLDCFLKYVITTEVIKPENGKNNS